MKGQIVTDFIVKHRINNGPDLESVYPELLIEDT
jgi:hypothetical protein